jgi:hypothetical protein
MRLQSVQEFLESVEVRAKVESIRRVEKGQRSWLKIWPWPIFVQEVMPTYGVCEHQVSPSPEVPFAKHLDEK